MPFDEDGTGDHVGHGVGREPDADSFRPLPHPDDRLWRHPSELRTATPRPWAAAAPVRSAPQARRLSPTRPSWTLVLVATLGGAALAAGSLTALGPSGRAGEGSAAEEVDAAPTASTTPLVGSPGDAQDDAAAALADAVEPAIVRVEGPDGAGSGLLLRDDGVVLTSTSIVGQDREDSSDHNVPVTLADGTRALGRLVGVDPVTEVAVLKLPTRRYPAVVVSESVRARSGTTVFIPAGRGDEGGGLTKGVVTSSTWTLHGVDRPARNGLLQIGMWPEPSAESSGSFEPPTPGGAVIDEDGAVVGMTTSGSTRGWSYAVPIDVASKVTRDFLETGAAQHAWLGIHGRDAEGSAAGAVVTDVAQDGPAEQHLQGGEVIVAADGIPVPNMATLQARLLLNRPGDQMAITYQRLEGTLPETVEITLAQRG